MNEEAKTQVFDLGAGLVTVMVSKLGSTSGRQIYNCCPDAAGCVLRYTSGTKSHVISRATSSVYNYNDHFFDFLQLLVYRHHLLPAQVPGEF